MEPGLYVTFFTQGSSFENDLPPVGPLEHLVIVDRRIVADRKSVHHTDGLGGGNRWIQAELEKYADGLDGEKVKQSIAASEAASRTVSEKFYENPLIRRYLEQAT